MRRHPFFCSIQNQVFVLVVLGLVLLAFNRKVSNNYYYETEVTRSTAQKEEEEFKNDYTTTTTRETHNNPEEADDNNTFQRGRKKKQRRKRKQQQEQQQQQEDEAEKEMGRDYNDNNNTLSSSSSLLLSDGAIEPVSYSRWPFEKRGYPCFLETHSPWWRTGKLPANRGFLFLKTHKTGSSTAAGIHLRIVRNVAARVFGSSPQQQQPTQPQRRRQLLPQGEYTNATTAIASSPSSLSYPEETIVQIDAFESIEKAEMRRSRRLLDGDDSDKEEEDDDEIDSFHYDFLDGDLLDDSPDDESTDDDIPDLSNDVFDDDMADGSPDDHSSDDNVGIITDSDDSDNDSIEESSDLFRETTATGTRMATDNINATTIATRDSMTALNKILHKRRNGRGANDEGDDDDNKEKMCVSRFEHETALQMKYARRKKRKSFLWSILRDPTQRAISHFFHFGVSRYKIEPTDDNFKRYVRSKKVKNYYMRYLTLKRYKRKSPREMANAVQHILNEYDFIAITERMDESAVVLQMLLGLKTADVLYISAKGKGNYDAGGFQNTCVYIQPSFVSEEMKSFFESDDWKHFVRYDRLLYDAANRSLDRTIDEVLGRDAFDENLRKFRYAQRVVHEKCHNQTRFPCDGDGTKNPRAKTDCLWKDSGCGSWCIDYVSAKLDLW